MRALFADRLRKQFYASSRLGFDGFIGNIATHCFCALESISCGRGAEAECDECDGPPHIQCAQEEYTGKKCRKKRPRRLSIIARVLTDKKRPRHECTCESKMQ